MRKFNLQLFGEPVQGKQLVYLYRVLADEATEDATAIAFVTENTRTKSKDAETTVTKDGTVRTPGAPEVEITSTSLFAAGDSLPERFEDAMDNDEIIEIWEANLAEPVGENSNKFKGRYFQGYLTEFELSSSAEEAVEYSTTFAINGSGVKGEVTVNAEQQAIADYVFKDTAKTGA